MDYTAPENFGLLWSTLDYIGTSVELNHSNIHQGLESRVKVILTAKRKCNVVMRHGAMEWASSRAPLPSLIRHLAWLQGYALPRHGPTTDDLKSRVDSG